MLSALDSLSLLNASGLGALGAQTWADWASSVTSWAKTTQGVITDLKKKQTDLAAAVAALQGQTWAAPKDVKAATDAIAALAGTVATLQASLAAVSDSVTAIEQRFASAVNWDVGGAGA